MQHSNITDDISPSDEVKINLNMLSTLMLDRIGGHVDCTDIVAIYQYSAPRGCAAPEEAGAANWPLPLHWPPRYTRLLHLTLTWCSGAWKTRR
jgi:hypothetical protein